MGVGWGAVRVGAGSRASGAVGQGGGRDLSSFSLFFFPPLTEPLGPAYPPTSLPPSSRVLTDGARRCLPYTFIFRIFPCLVVRGHPLSLSHFPSFPTFPHFHAFVMPFSLREVGEGAGFRGWRCLRGRLAVGYPVWAVMEAAGETGSDGAAGGKSGGKGGARDRAGPRRAHARGRSGSCGGAGGCPCRAPRTGPGACAGCRAAGSCGRGRLTGGRRTW